ncbi:MAG: hypothetical protein IJ190_13685 [Prevotella sp.]|nr:hypothetical protein [Prevotella sp.]
MKKMKTTILALLCAITIVLVGCDKKGDGKQGYTISQLYHTSNQEILEKIRKPALQSFCAETRTERTFMSMSSYTTSHVRVHKAVSDGKHLHSNMYVEDKEGDYWHRSRSFRVDPELDGLSYANVSKSIEEDDWFYTNYDSEKDRFFFYYIDLK